MHTLVENSVPIICPSRNELIEYSIKNNEAYTGSDGQLCVTTGKYTGRAANDKYIVNSSPALNNHVEFGPAGKELSIEVYEKLSSHVKTYLHGKKVYILDFDTGFFKCRII